jgi:ABC-type branched-subunit amino acid transport system permease subunit
VFVAVSTWVLAWLFALFLLAFPSASGGAQGLVVPHGSLLGLAPTATTHYELALALVALALLGSWRLARSQFGLTLAAYRQQPAAAEGVGVRAAHIRLGAFVGAAVVAGLAGGLGVQLAHVADAGVYGPFLSFELLVAVLLGGAAAAAGPLVGILLLGAVSLAAGWLGVLGGGERFRPMLAALLVLVALSLGGRGLVPWVREVVAARRRPRR